MRVIIITDDEAPIVLSLTGRSHDELDELHDEVNATLAHLFIEAHDTITAVRPVCDHRSFSHGVPESGIRSADCVKHGVLA